jgi:hypothetical protein
MDALSDWYFDRNEHEPDEEADKNLPAQRDAGDVPVSRPPAMPAGRPAGEVAQPSEQRGPTTPIRAATAAVPSMLRWLVIGLPSWVYGGFLVWLATGDSLPEWLVWTICAGWLIVGVVVAWFPIERVPAALLRRLGVAGPRDAGLVTEALLPIAHVAGVNMQDYAVRVEATSAATSTSSSGRTLAVTTWSLDLPVESLRGVLAHELGRLLGRPAYFDRLGLWCALPARIVVWLVRRLFALLFRISAVVGWLATTLVIATFAVGFTQGTSDLVFSVGVSAFVVWPWLLAWLSRVEVGRADRQAARLGYGRELTDVLTLWQEHDAERHAATVWPVRLLEAWVPAGSRIRALNRTHQRRLRTR